VVFALAEGKKIGRTEGHRKALSSEEESKLLAAAVNQASPNRSQTLGTFLRVALLTGMRSGEIAGLTWGQLDFARRALTAGRAKTASGTGRQIPMNSQLFETLAAHAECFTSRFGEPRPGYCLFRSANPRQTIRRGVSPTLQALGKPCGSGRASSAGCMTCGTRRQRKWLKLAFLKARCSP
jgi:integrase